MPHVPATSRVRDEDDYRSWYAVIVLLTVIVPVAGICAWVAWNRDHYYYEQTNVELELGGEGQHLQFLVRIQLDGLGGKHWSVLARRGTLLTPDESELLLTGRGGSVGTVPNGPDRVSIVCTAGYDHHLLRTMFQGVAIELVER